jgi:hypothetical protein
MSRYEIEERADGGYVIRNTVNLAVVVATPDFSAATKLAALLNQERTHRTL